MMLILKLAGVSAMLGGGLVAVAERPRDVSSEAPKVYQERVAPEPATAPRGPVVLADAGQIGPRPVASDAAPVGAGTPVGAGAVPVGCQAQAWPYRSQDCVAGEAGQPRRVVRTITIERRDAPNTSTLVRVPVETVAIR